MSTVWDQPNHRFCNKWAVLNDPKNPHSGPRGFLKCDIMILGKGFLRKPVEKPESNEILEENLLVPQGGMKDRYRAKVVFSVFRADSFSPRFLNLPDSKIVLPYVKITYGGLVMKTKIAKNKALPVWNEELTFADLIPPLCQNILIEVCDRHKVRRRESMGNTNINMSNLYEDGLDGFLPTFGPSFVYLYHPLKKYERHKNVSSMQNSFTYSCRLLIAMRTEIMNFAEDIIVQKKKEAKKIRTKAIPPLLETAYFNYKKFILFGVIFDVLFFDNKYLEKNIAIRLTIGPKKDAGKIRTPEEEEREMEAYLNSLRNPPVLNVVTTCNTTPGKNITVKADYSFMEFYGQFPCVHVYGEWPDAMRKMYRTNVIRKVVSNCRDEVNRVKYELEFERGKRKESKRKLRNILRDFSKSCEVILLLTNVIWAEDTNLCREKGRVYHRELNEIVRKTRLALKNEKIETEDELTKISTYLSRLTKYAEDPEDSFPDTEVWVLRNGKITAQIRLRTEDIVYSSNSNERGNMSGKTQTIILRSKKEKIQAKLDIFLWFGLADDFIECLKMLPPGYKQEGPVCSSIPDLPIPSDLIYEEQHSFECRVHIYQAKILIGFGKTGLADPFAKVIIAGQTRTTDVKKETLSPMWNQTLIFPQLTLYGSLNYIKKNSMTIIVEILDYNKTRMAKLIGRSFVKPAVILKKEKYVPPKLKWEGIQQELSEVGKILMVTELVELSEYSNESETEYFQSIPDEIMPISSKYRLEILFWGIRELKRKKTVKNKVYVTLECGEKIIYSPILRNVRHKLNFPYDVQFFELDLPEAIEFSPPLTLKLYHISSLTKSRKYVANCIVPNIRELCYYPMELKRDMKIRVVGEKKKKKPKSNTEEKNMEIKKNAWKEKRKILLRDKLDQILYSFVRCYRYCKCKMGKKCEMGAYESATPVLEEEALNWWIRYHASTKDSDLYPEVPVFKVYEDPLEDQPEFKEFQDFLQKFNMVVGPRKKRKEGVFVASAKAALKLYKWTEESYLMNDGLLSMSPTNDAIKYVVRAYIICAKNLAPRDINGKSDPYLFVQLGKQIINDRKHYSSRQLNPTFGKCFEFRGTFPYENLLRVKVIDYDASSKDDLIGETVIDIENRYYSKHHATCGLAKSFEREGANAWRDIFMPTFILAKVCKQSNLDPPIYELNQVRIENYIFKTFVPYDSQYPEEIQALSVLHRWHEIGPKGYHLVPEHLETRPLYHPSLPGIEQGKLEMWVDIFPADFRYMPPKVDVTPRPPIPMELRAIVWNVDNVVLDDKSFFFHEKMSDIYVKGWILSLEDDTQRTDVHYRSLNGEGNFNWRFIFRFDYIPTERMMIVKKKLNAFDMSPEERKHHCKLEIQIWDNDAFGDDYLGTLILELSSMPRGAKMQNRCTLKMLAPNATKINLFKIGKTRGWWPFR